MKSQEAIIQVRDRVNKNSSNVGAPFDKRKILTALNASQDRYLNFCLEKKNDDTIRLVQKFLVASKPITSYKIEPGNYQLFTLPDNFFKFSDISRAIAKKNNCTLNISLYEQSKNIAELLSDENNKPSFEYSETFYHLTDDKLKVFISDFTIQSLELDYYRIPNRISVEGIENLDGSMSDESDPEWPDDDMDKIIDLTVRTLDINSENLQKVQFDYLKINQKQ